MKLETILELPECKVLVKGNPEREISKVFCCDLLSIAMGKAPTDSVWVTVMGNKKHSRRGSSCRCSLYCTGRRHWNG